MPCSAASCGSSSRAADTGSVTTQFYWRRPVRQVRENAWSISAPGGARRGWGVGAAGLALARRVDGAEVVLVEIDAALAALAAENAQLNGLSARVSAIALDVA